MHGLWMTDGTAADISPALAAWGEALRDDIDAHFAEAHQRVESVYRQHFRSLPKVLQRHWQYRRDVPADLAALPRSVWRLVSRRGKSERPLTGKEQAIAQLIAVDVLDLDGLQARLFQRLESHPDYRPETVDALRAELAGDPEQAAQRLREAVARWGLSQDSSRDLLLFLVLGLAGRGLSDKVLFGSASLIGMSAASSLYLSQQGGLAAWWASWFGVPGWVTLGGAAAGVVGVMALTPVLAPFIECGFNRLWRRQRLHRLLDEVHQQLRPPLREHLWQYGSYLQFLPDLLQLLRQLR